MEVHTPQCGLDPPLPGSSDFYYIIPVKYTIIHTGEIKNIYYLRLHMDLIMLLHPH